MAKRFTYMDSTFNITPVTGDGYQMLRTYKAVAKSDPWLESGRDTGRFRFTINTVSIESLIYKLTQLKAQIN